MNLIDFKEIFVSDDFKSFHLQVTFFNYECIKNQGGEILTSWSHYLFID